MSVIGYAWWLSSLVVRLLVDYWPITLVLLIATYVSISRGGLPEDQQLRSLLWGAIAHIEFGIRPAIPWRIAVLVVVVLLHCAMSVSVVYISRGYRRQTAWLVGLISWVAIACLIQSSLALTGRLDPPI
jgi:hypothetical protein